MDIIHPATAWWIACGLLIAAELATGTFYLLMLSVGCAAGAIAAWLDAGTSVQMVAAALLGGASVAICHRLRKRSRPATLPAAFNPDVNLDIGQPVQVDQWASDGSTSVKYRGAAWRARYVGGDTPSAGQYVIRAIDGSCLMLDR